MMNNIETIQFAAIKIMNYNLIIYGKSHEECYKKWMKLNVDKNAVKWENGFLTNNCRFVDRKEASSIAYLSGQIDNYKADQILLSEELWDRKSCGRFKYDETLGYIK